MKKRLSDYIEEIIERNEKLKKKDFESQLKWRPVTSLAKRLGLEKDQTLVFAHAYFFSLTEKSFTALKIREKLSSRAFDLPKIVKILNQLYKLKMLKREDNYSGEEFSISKEILLLIDDNKAPDVEKLGAKKDILEVSDEIKHLVLMRYDHLITYDEFYNELDQVLELNNDYKLFSFLRQNGVKQEEWLLLIVTFIAHIGGEDNACLKKLIKNLFRGTRTQLELRNKLIKQETQLQEKGFIEFVGENLKSAEKICIPDEIMKTLLEENYDMVMYKTNAPLDDDNLIQPTEIMHRDLFYNNGEVSQIDTLKDLLQPNKFSEVQNNLKNEGYKSGFCVLLHGTPGTGKTETVMQLAKSTGRLVLKVDIASIRDKFVGESEKNISKIFKQYEKLCKQTELTPILLFNEADALFNKRMRIKQSVDQMNNAMQNILLEALENFDGILFATTNLVPNMDKAFERRFLYKIKFSNPSDKARKAIWKTHFPELEKPVLDEIAAAFNLSGGQIENVARKVKLQTILYQHKVDLGRIKNICNEELLENKARKRIGFNPY